MRDISNLETPPEDRLAVETRVTRFQGELIRHAVMRELNRGGQIFFVHNRVEDIEILARRLRQIVPEARLGVAHGQMPEHELERVMLDFVDHRFDMLLATTIVESGLDIPNANTIFIDEADRYGLADLHQLRGRVGRYKHRAYCYLLVDPNKNLSPVGRQAAARHRGVQRHGGRIRHRHARPGDPRGGKHPGHAAERAYRRGGLRTVLQPAGTGRGPLKRLPPQDLDRGGHRPARRGLHPPRLRARHAAENRPLPPPGPDRHARGTGGLPPGSLWTVLGRRRRWSSSCSGWPSCGSPPTAGKSAPSTWRTSTWCSTYASARRIRELAAQSGGALRVVDGRTAYLPLDGGVAEAEAIRRRVKSLLQLQ